MTQWSILAYDLFKYNQLFYAYFFPIQHSLAVSQDGIWLFLLRKW